MPHDPTRFSRVSFGFVDSVQSIVDEDANDTGTVVSTTGPIEVGIGSASIEVISSTTHATAIGAIATQDVSLTTLGISNATRGDSFIVNLDSEFSGAVGDYQLVWNAHSGDTTGEVNLVVSNTSTGSVNPTDGVIRVTRISWSDYL